MLGSTGTTTFLLAALLVALGVAMIFTTVWLVRATRTDSRVLGPLEVMGDRRWHRADAERRTRSLDAARPPDALPPAPMLDADPPPQEQPAVAANCESTEQEPASTTHSSAEEEPEKEPESEPESEPAPAETA
jgi:hypothetical protein